ncbi:NADH-quinone oxidoreductase subunit J [Candidatus Desantisbacteria bacterium]|nr:NADH-quinone oxidoreductase subunit J [Candidatus Desantisbacteria bacterium]
MVFYIFGTLAFFTALLVVTQKNVVHSALSLILFFVAMAGLFISLEAEFLAGLQIFLYAGGIMVMFVFVVMIINIPKSQREPRFTKQRYIALVVMIILFIEVIYLLSKTVFKGTKGIFTPEKVAKISNTVAVGQVLYREYLFAFELISLVVLVSMIGAVVLSTRRIRQRKSRSPMTESGK